MPSPITYQETQPPILNNKNILNSLGGVNNWSLSWTPDVVVARCLNALYNFGVTLLELVQAAGGSGDAPIASAGSLAGVTAIMNALPITNLTVNNIYSVVIGSGSTWAESRWMLIATADPSSETLVSSATAGYKFTNVG